MLVVSMLEGFLLQQMNRFCSTLLVVFSIVMFAFSAGTDPKYYFTVSRDLLQPGYGCNWWKHCWSRYTEKFFDLLHDWTTCPMSLVTHPFLLCSGDAVVNVYINHEKKFAFVEMRSVEEASNAMALDGIIFEVFLFSSESSY